MELGPDRGTGRTLRAAHEGAVFTVGLGPAVLFSGFPNKHALLMKCGKMEPQVFPNKHALLMKCGEMEPWGTCGEHVFHVCAPWDLGPAPFVPPRAPGAEGHRQRPAGLPGTLAAGRGGLRPRHSPPDSRGALASPGPWFSSPQPRRSTAGSRSSPHHPRLSLQACTGAITTSKLPLGAWPPPRPPSQSLPMASR